MNSKIATLPFSKTSFFEKMQPFTYLILLEEWCQFPPFSKPKNHRKIHKTVQELGKK